jgi:hypothetical protein
MTVKQISVWVYTQSLPRLYTSDSILQFQNRRNRAPKATDYKGNRVIIRKKMTLEDLEREAPKLVIPEEARRSQDSKEEEAYSEEEDVVNTSTCRTCFTAYICPS